jgi:hypothetical protein
MACHGNQEFLAGIASDSAQAERLHTDAAQFAESVHGRMGFSCTLCHSDVGDYPHGTVSPVDCGGCHAKARAEHSSSIHGRPHPLTGEAPTTCADCHTNHHILKPSDPGSSVYHQTEYEVCAHCHSDAERMGRFGQDDVQTIESYVNSVHGRGLIDKGLSVAPTCTNCHGREGSGAHEIEPVSTPDSPTNRLNVCETCGRCHVGIMDQYDRGIHGEEFHAGNMDMPTCIDCHAEHAIQPVTSPESHVYPTHVAQTCTACHDRLDLNEKYGLASARGSTFLGSYHGVALETGILTVAHCESCHGAHMVLPSSDPRSMVNPANLRETCGTCHPGIGAGVTRGKIHVASVRDDINTLAFAVQWFYFIMIGGIVIYSAVMIYLDLYRRRVVDRRDSGQAHA